MVPVGKHDGDRGDDLSLGEIESVEIVCCNAQVSEVKLVAFVEAIIEGYVVLYVFADTSEVSVGKKELATWCLVLTWIMVVSEYQYQINTPGKIAKMCID